MIDQVTLALTTRIDTFDQWYEAPGSEWRECDLEAARQRVQRIRDLLWTLREDRIGSARRVDALLGGRCVGLRTAHSWLAVDKVLEALDRLEVRGRDSAGIQIWVNLDTEDRVRLTDICGELVASNSRSDSQYRNGSVEFLDCGIVFVFKRSSVIGRPSTVDR